jgi:predicted transcriptional regulator
MRELSVRAGELEVQLERLVDATAEEIDEQRGDIAQALSSLTASVRRELFEMRQAVTE